MTPRKVQDLSGQIDPVVSKFFVMLWGGDGQSAAQDRIKALNVGFRGEIDGPTGAVGANPHCANRAHNLNREDETLDPDPPRPAPEKALCTD